MSSAFWQLARQPSAGQAALSPVDAFISIALSGGLQMSLLQVAELTDRTFLDLA